MRNPITVIITILLLLNCQDAATQSSNFVSSNDELAIALSEAKPGDDIVMKNGAWKDVQIKVTTSGTKDQPITLRAETPSKD